MTELKRGICLFDMHVPEHEEQLLKNVERYMEDHKWDYVVYGGDFMNLGSISRHSLEGGNNRELEGKRLKKEYVQASGILRRHRKIAKKAEIYYLEGNHEDWAERMIDRFPTLEGMLEVSENLPLNELGIKLIKPRHSAKIGSLYFIHGDVLGRYVPVFHSRKIVELYNRNIVYGDRHQCQSYIKASPIDLEDKHGAWCIPTMGKLNPNWAKDRPNNWVNGFGTFYIKDDFFAIYTVISVKNGFISPEGKEYR